MPQIARADRVAEFKSARSDDEVTEWDIDCFRRFLTADPRDDSAVAAVTG